MSTKHCEPDLAIVGAGPAGLASAITAVKAGMSVSVLDDQHEPGGQIWRGAGSADTDHAAQMGPEYLQGQKNVREFLSCGARYLSRQTVWQIEFEGDQPIVYAAGPTSSHVLRPKKLVLATGALERPAPVPGWTLPGVMTAGGLQILLKTGGLCPDKAVLAGAGPLLWLIASQLIAAGHPPLAVIEQISIRNYIRAAKRLPAALLDAKPLGKGIKLIAGVHHAGVPVFRIATNLRIEGDVKVRAISFKDMLGKQRRIEADTVGIHQGVIPNQQISRLLRLPHTWDEVQGAFLPDRDTSCRVAPNTYMIGDGARIGGAEVAWLEGQLVSTIIAQKDHGSLKRALRKAKAVRPFLDLLYRVPADWRQPDDQTILCRCEAVTAGQIRQAVRDGAMGPNQVKFMIRPGMGPCQGRVCGSAVSEVVADTLEKDVQETGYFRIRPPLKPMPLEVIAGHSDKSAKTISLAQEEMEPPSGRDN